MNKAEIVARMARDAGLTKADSNRVLDAFLQNVSRALKKGDKVTLVGFGTFDVYQKRARIVLNPTTGKPIRIPARRVARFSAGKGLKKTLAR
jgi:DNA-binding protein HU-beta